MIAPYRETLDPNEREHSGSITDKESPQVQRLRAAIARVAELLPISGPITSYAFLNPLQALEDRPFSEGIERGAELYDCQPWLPEESYRALMADGRIDAEDLGTVLYESLRDDGSVPVGSLCTRFELRAAMLKYPLPFGSPAEVRWYIDDSQSFSRFRADAPSEARRQLLEDTRQWLMTEVAGAAAKGSSDDPYTKLLAELAAQLNVAKLGYWTKSDSEMEAIYLRSLWRICESKIGQLDLPLAADQPPLRLRDLLLESTGEDSDLLVHDVMIRYCAAFADQGLASWSLPGRAHGFFRAFCDLHGTPGGPPEPCRQGLAAEIERLRGWHAQPIESIRESLCTLGYAEDQWPEVIQATLLSLRGWAGLIWNMESRPDRFARPAAPGTLLEYLAVYLILERLALKYLAQRTPSRVRQLNRLREELLQARCAAAPPRDRTIDAFIIFQLAQVLRWSPTRLARLTAEDWKTLIEETDAFGGLQRRRLMHAAYERHFECQTLNALTAYGQRATTRPPAPTFQAVFCIDAREESFRRHFEEVCRGVETFGMAGFFGVPMYYRGLADAHFTPLCPIVVKPKHWVTEEVLYPLGNAHRRRSTLRRAVATATRQLHLGSQSIARGALLTAGLGTLASVPLIASVLFPRATGRFRNLADRLTQPPSLTRLRLHRKEKQPGPENGHLGFTIEEMADLAERALREIGLTYDFARLVVFVGHHSSSLNNPHNSVYDCGACTGKPGGPNARALAAMLNDTYVRAILARRGLEIPRDTLFLGAMHNTCDDTVVFFDLPNLPISHTDDFEDFKRSLAIACQRNAHERCRRFYSAPLNMSFSAAHRHVEVRSLHLAQRGPSLATPRTPSVSSAAGSARAGCFSIDDRS